jgi:hypothetical protein
MAQKVKKSNLSRRKKIEYIYATQLKSNQYCSLRSGLASGGAFFNVQPGTNAD